MNKGIYVGLALGRYFGFPDCCTAEFDNDSCHATRWAYPDGPWLGTGFMPCLDCAPKALNFDQFVARHIVPNRVCHLPFPQQPHGLAMTAVIDRLLEEFDPASFVTEPPGARYMYRPLQVHAQSPNFADRCKEQACAS